MVPSYLKFNDLYLDLMTISLKTRIREEGCIFKKDFTPSSQFNILKEKNCFLACQRC